MSAPSNLADAPVLVGVDESAQSLIAVRLAAREAVTYQRPLCVLHAFNWAAQPVEPSGDGPRVAAERLIARAVRVAAEAEPGLEIRSEITEGPAVAALVRRSDAATLVAIGAGGLAGPDCVPQDAPAVQLAARAGCPVLVIRAEPPPTGPTLVGVDTSASSARVLDLAFDHAARRGTGLLVVRAVEERPLTQSPPGPDDGNDRSHPNGPIDPNGRSTDSGSGSGSGDFGPAGSRDTAGLSDLLASYRRRYPTVRVEHRTLVGDPHEVLVAYSRGAELVVVGARGDEPWRGMLGEVSQSLLYHSPAPVLVVRGVDGRAPRRF